MFTIKLVPRGKQPKTYKSEIRMRECLEAYELADRWGQANGDYGELIDDAADFVSRCFDRQFTAEELLDGYEGSPYVFFPEFMRQAIQYVNGRIAAFPMIPGMPPESETEA